MNTKPGRRRFLRSFASLVPLSTLPPPLLFAAEQPVIKRAIPSTQEVIPVIGMGSWLTFDISYERAALAQRVEVLRHFFELGGQLIDSSPMYGNSERVIGQCLQELKNDQNLFAATKVWMWGKEAGISQMIDSLAKWQLSSFQLMQIHNMLDWHDHLDTLKAWKQEGRIKYIGITTSHGRRHTELEKALQENDFDFVQFTYNILDREAESRLLPLAQERGIAVIINRPFQGGSLFRFVDKKPLPAWAADFDCQNWAQFFLKFIVSHPAVTCAIPATSKPDHMLENMGAAYGRLPSSETRNKMALLVQNW